MHARLHKVALFLQFFRISHAANFQVDGYHQSFIYHLFSTSAPLLKKWTHVYQWLGFGLSDEGFEFQSQAAV